MTISRGELGLGAVQSSAIEQFWLVTDASPVSELIDVMSKCSAEEFLLQVKGGLTASDHPTIYLDEETAKQDAVARIHLARIVDEYHRAVATNDHETLAEMRAGFAVGRKEPS